MSPVADTITLDDTARAVVCDIADQFEHSWNTADGQGYAEPFAVDADYITIHGIRLVGRRTIAVAMSQLFATGYADSTIGLRVTQVRCLAPSVIVAQIEHVVSVPGGPPAGDVTTLATVVITDTIRGWEVTTLHATLVDGQPSPESE